MLYSSYSVIKKEHKHIIGLRDMGLLYCYSKYILYSKKKFHVQARLLERQSSWGLIRHSAIWIHRYYQRSLIKDNVINYNYHNEFSKIPSVHLHIKHASITHSLISPIWQAHSVYWFSVVTIVLLYQTLRK